MRPRTAALVGTGATLVAAVLLVPGSAPSVDAAPSKKAPKAEIIELGRRLFMDPTVSRLGKNSCASCHDPERAFGDSRANSPDDTGPTRRHSQTLVDLTGDGYHWDGEFKTVRQLLVARVAPADMANEQSEKNFEERLAIAARSGETTDRSGPPPVPGTERPVPAPSGYGVSPPSDVPITPVAERLMEDGRYAEAFSAAFGTATPTTAHILDAMDAYCASIKTTANAFDRFLAGDDAALSASARRGLALFEGRAKCATCHTTRGEDGRATFTDGAFHDTGVAYHTDPLWQQGVVGAPAKDIGRGGVTFLSAEAAKFKTPTLRDVALRAPYMHDGSFATLTDVVLYYAQGGTANPNLDPAIRAIDMEQGDVKDLVEFLVSLTGAERAGLGFPLARATPLEVTVEDLAGNLMPCLTIDVKAAGDRLRGADAAKVPERVMTTLKGFATIERPLATHVSLSCRGYELGLSRLIPDTSKSQTLIATPLDAISLRMRRAPNGPPLPETIRVIPSDRGVSMGSCGPSAVATLTKMRRLPNGEVLYAGKALANGETRRCTLVFDAGTTQVLAEIRLGGGASESLLLAPPRVSPVRRPSSPTPPTPPGGSVPHDPGEEPDHGTDREAGGRDVDDRR